jgi:parallel beta-helix repeat protein
MARKTLALVLALVVAGGTATYVAHDETKKPVSFNDLPATKVEAEKESALVADEDRRLNQVRAITALSSDQKQAKLRVPYRLVTGAGYTLVLTARKLPYTISDLVKLAPQTFVRQADGSFYLSENLYVTLGATLSLYNPGGLVLHMASSASGFSSIVAFGGNINLSGSANAPVKITSWDARAAAPDLDPRDGRAYIRAIGGQFAMDYTEVANLGFWSGRTGGIGLTGTDRPNTGATQTEDQLHGKTEKNAARDAARKAKANGGDATPKDGSVGVIPSGSIKTPGAGGEYDVQTQGYVNVRITRSKISGNAYGVFISGANGVLISDTTVEKSFLHGVMLHRFTYNGRIERTLSRQNKGDGFTLARAAHDIRITASTAEDNGGNGFTLNGQPLADGQSAAGESIEAYGNNTVENSIARHNGRYGVEVQGGINVAVQNNEIIGGDMGIVARRDASNINIVGNQISGSKRQGIAIRDGVLGSTVTGNVITSATTGVYVRDAIATVRGNTIQDATLHGVTMIGGVKDSVVSFNVVTGAGPSAVDRARSHGHLTVADNQTFGWHDTSSLWVQLKRFARPLTLLWLLIIFMLVTSALQARRRKKFGIKRGMNPYELQTLMEERPVHELTKRIEREKVDVFASEPPMPNGRFASGGVSQ